ncbi:MAG: hypothetical protein WC859_04455 [Elusimicrobiota bacterium]
MKTLGLLSAILMPFFNIPLIVRIIRRRCSDDISLTWVIGVWICIIGMLPASLQSEDIVLKAFGMVNIVFFSGVVAVVLFYSSVIRKR